MLRRMPADADPEHEAAAAGLLEGGRHPGDYRRRPVHHVEDERHETESARAPGQRRERRPALEDGIAPDSPADEVVPDRDAVVARGLQAPGLLTEPCVRDADRPQVDEHRERRRRPRGGAQSPAVTAGLVAAARATRMVVAVRRSSSSSGRYESSEVTFGPRTSLTVRMVAARTSSPAACARAAR